MQHTSVRFLHPNFPEDRVDDEVLREDKMVRWADSFYLNSVRMVAAASLAESGSLEKAASLLECSGWSVPAGFLTDDEEDEFGWGGEPSALQAYVEKDEEGIRKARDSIGFYLAGTGQSMDPRDEFIEPRG